MVPVYDVRPTGPKHRQRFLCEMRVPGFDYVAAGNSTVKKDAQSFAARDFVAFLVRQGLMQARFVLLLLRLFVPGSQFPAVFRIQIQWGSLDPDPDSQSGSRRAKITLKNREKIINFIF